MRHEHEPLDEQVAERRAKDVLRKRQKTEAAKGSVATAEASPQVDTAMPLATDEDEKEYVISAGTSSKQLEAPKPQRLEAAQRAKVIELAQKYKDQATAACDYVNGFSNKAEAVDHCRAGYKGAAASSAHLTVPSATSSALSSAVSSLAICS